MRGLWVQGVEKDGFDHQRKYSQDSHLQFTLTWNSAIKTRCASKWRFKALRLCFTHICKCFSSGDIWGKAELREVVPTFGENTCQSFSSICISHAMQKQWRFVLQNWALKLWNYFFTKHEFAFPLGSGLWVQGAEIASYYLWRKYF